MFTIDRNILYGKHTGATPNGRRAFEPLSRNLDAGNARDYNRIIELIQSVTKIDATNVPKESVLDVMLHPGAVNTASFSTLF